MKIINLVLKIHERKKKGETGFVKSKYVLGYEYPL